MEEDEEEEEEEEASRRRRKDDNRIVSHSYEPLKLKSQGVKLHGETTIQVEKHNENNME